MEYFARPMHSMMEFLELKQHMVKQRPAARSQNETGNEQTTTHQQQATSAPIFPERPSMSRRGVGRTPYPSQWMEVSAAYHMSA